MTSLIATTLPTEFPTVALTTIFTPAATCSLPLVSYAINQTAFTWGTGHGTTTIFRNDPACYPTSFYAYDQSLIYSPGVCPNGQTVAISTIIDGTTSARCCPSGASFVLTDPWPHCISSATSPGTIIIGVTASTGGSFAIAQKPIWVAWATRDLASFTPASAPLLQSSTSHHAVAHSSTTTEASAAASAHQPHSTSPVNSSSASSSPNKNSGGSLSTGAKAGIGIGVALGVLIAVLLGALIWFMKRKRTKKAADGSAYHQPRETQNDYKRTDIDGRFPTVRDTGAMFVKKGYEPTKTSPHDIASPMRSELSSERPWSSELPGDIDRRR